MQAFAHDQHRRLYDTDEALFLVRMGLTMILPTVPSASASCVEKYDFLTSPGTLIPQEWIVRSSP
jgi:hypothetical protein